MTLQEQADLDSARSRAWNNTNWQNIGHADTTPYALMEWVFRQGYETGPVEDEYYMANDILTGQWNALDTYCGVLDVFCICGHDAGWHVKHKDDCCHPLCDCDSFRERAILSAASDKTGE